MTSDSTIVSVKLCPEVGNDEYIVLRNCGGRRMIGFELIEGGLWRLPSSHLGRSKQKKKAVLNTANRPFWIGFSFASTCDFRKSEYQTLFALRWFDFHYFENYVRLFTTKVKITIINEHFLKRMEGFYLAPRKCSSEGPRL